MNATKTLLSTCTCVLGLAAGQSIGAENPEPCANAASVAIAGEPRQRIRELLTEQGLPSARTLAREITQEIVNGNGFVPGKATLRPYKVQLVSVERVERRSRIEPDRGAVGFRVRDRRGGVLSSLGAGFSRILRYLGLSD